VQLHYLELGRRDAPAVVFLHGNRGMIQEQIFSGVVELVAKRYRVICFDRPGYGHSSWPRLRVWTPEAQASLFARAIRDLGIEWPIGRALMGSDHYRGAGDCNAAAGEGCRARLRLLLSDTAPGRLARFRSGAPGYR
jgi:hypothetical protein